MKKSVSSLIILAVLAPMSALADRVKCESPRHDMHECAMNTRGEVRMVEQLSHTQCVEGVTWGLNKHSVWVKDGCRAVFESGGRGGGGGSNNVGRDWDRGCEDAKTGSYNRAHHSDAYEAGWQACKPNDSGGSQNVGRDWDRGCEDAKMGSYNRAHHSDAYESGWQACKPYDRGGSNNVGRDWDRGCEDAKMGSYNRAHHSDAYESGWQACKAQR
jgi:ribosomal protein L32